METTIMYRDYIGIMEKKMETTMIYRVYIGIMESSSACLAVSPLVPMRGHSICKQVRAGYFGGI